MGEEMNITREDLESVRDALCAAEDDLPNGDERKAVLEALAKIDAILKEKA